MTNPECKHCGNSLTFCDFGLAKKIGVKEMGCRCPCPSCQPSPTVRAEGEKEMFEEFKKVCCQPTVSNAEWCVWFVKNLLSENTKEVRKRTREETIQAIRDIITPVCKPTEQYGEKCENCDGILEPEACQCAGVAGALKALDALDKEV